MNQINFLPNSYRARLGTRTRRARETAIVGLIALAMVVYWVYGLSDTMRLRSEALRTEDQLANALSTEQQVQALQTQKKLLTDQRRLQREVRVPIRHYEVIRLLGSLMPESTALNELVLTNERPAPKPYVAPSDKPALEKTAKPGEKIEKPTDRIVIDLEGLAPDDLAVAEFIASLSGHPLIDGVKLSSSRYTDVRGVAARQFRMTGYIDLDREIVWEQAPLVGEADGGELAEVSNEDP